MCNVSIIMGVYNNQTTLRQALDSIISQTYNDWEFVICDDASTDCSYEILLEYKQKYPDKIILLRNSENMKLAFSLNRCLKKARGKYIARMDGDDISNKHRLEKQVQFLENNHQYDLVGTLMQSFDKNGLKHIVNIKEIPEKTDLPIFNPFHHATIMMKKSVFNKLNGYTVSKKTRRMEDVDLWYRFYENKFKGYNMQEVLYYVREDEAAYKRRKFTYYLDASKIVWSGVKRLNLPKKYYIYSFKPIMAWLTPRKLKVYWRKNKFRSKAND